jgi:hypothetical protein
MSGYLVGLLGKNRRARSAASLASNFGAEPEVVDGEDGTLYWCFQDKGLDVAFDQEDRLVCIFLYPGIAHDRGYHAEYGRFTGTLPEGLSFDMSRSMVHATLGPPDFSGGGEQDRYLGPGPRWDTYKRPAYYLHIQYLKGGERISLLELSVPDGGSKES